MKVVFDWEENIPDANGKKICSWLIAEHIRMMTTDGLVAVFIYSVESDYSEGLPYRIAAFVADCSNEGEFETPEEAKMCVDKRLRDAGYKTLPAHLKVLL
jgi:hypothetical protein